MYLSIILQYDERNRMRYYLQYLYINIRRSIRLYIYMEKVASAVRDMFNKTVSTLKCSFVNADVYILYSTKKIKLLKIYEITILTKFISNPI